MVHVSLEVALRHNTFKASGTQSIMETIEEIRKEFLKDVKKQVVLFSGPRKKFASSSILCFLYIPVSSLLSLFSATYCHFIGDHISSCHHHLRLNYSTNVLIGFWFCFVILPLPCPLAPFSSFIHYQKHFARVCLPDQAHLLLCVSFSGQPLFSYHISKAILPTRYTDTYLYQ